MGMTSDEGMLLHVLLIQEHRRQNEGRVDVSERPMKVKGCRCVGMVCKCSVINGFYPMWFDAAP